MYSIVLAAVLTTGTATPAWGWGCHGCNGCWGGCSGCSGCYGCWGCGGCYGCYGCCGGCWGGCYGCWGGCYGYYGGYSAGAVTTAYTYPLMAPSSSVVDVQSAYLPAQSFNYVATNPAAATSRITVRLPAEAKLFVNGVACPLTSELRSFDTPQLPRGKEFYYTLKAEIVRDGQTLSESRRVTLAAARNVSVAFGNLQPVRTASR